MPDLIDRLRQVILAGKFDPDRQSVEYPFQRGWNGALEWVETQLAKAEKEEQK